MGGCNAELIVFIVGVNGMMEILLPRQTFSAIVIFALDLKNRQSLITSSIAELLTSATYDAGNTLTNLTQLLAVFCMS